MEFSCTKGKVYVCVKFWGDENSFLKEMHNVPYVGNPRYPKTIANSEKPIFFSRNEERNG
jgi:hypothetical protein